MPTLAPQNVSQHTINNWLVVSSTSQSLNPTSVIQSALQTPQDIHLDFAKRVLRYMSGTMDYDILYKSVTQIWLEGYTDVDWAGYKAD